MRNKDLTFYFKKRLANEITHDEMFTLISNIKSKYNYVLTRWSWDISKPMIIELNSNISIIIIKNVDGNFLEVQTENKEHFDILWQFFTILK